MPLLRADFGESHRCDVRRRPSFRTGHHPRSVSYAQVRALIPSRHDRDRTGHDPDERARVVFGEAGVAAALHGELDITRFEDVEVTGRAGEDPTPSDDAWVIFTSGSTGLPKGVAVTHRNAAAFVDAEARIFVQDNPIGPHDRVMAGLSVAFDASCEEIWLAFAHGACLVPAPRSLVRSGVDVGPWLTANQVSIVSTVPTLASLWPPEALEAVRLEAAEHLDGSRVLGVEVDSALGPTDG